MVNAQKWQTITCPGVGVHENVLSVLQREGYIRALAKLSPTKRSKAKAVRFYRLKLKYYEGAAVIREIKRVSKPGRRVYSQIADLKRVYNGLGHSDCLDAAWCDVGQPSP